MRTHNELMEAFDRIADQIQQSTASIREIKRLAEETDEILRRALAERTLPQYPR